MDLSCLWVINDRHQFFYPVSFLCIFSEKLVMEKGRVATMSFTEPIQVLFKIAKVLQGFKNKKEVENNLLSTLAPQVREQLFHPVTL